MRVGETMRCSGVDDQLGVFDNFRGGATRRIDRYYLVVVAVNNERRHVELLQILCEIRLRKRPDALVCILNDCGNRTVIVHFGLGSGQSIRQIFGRDRLFPLIEQRDPNTKSDHQHNQRTEAKLQSRFHFRSR